MNLTKLDNLQRMMVRKKSIPKVINMLYYSIYITYLKRKIYRNKTDQQLLEVKGWSPGGTGLQNSSMRNLYGDGSVLNLDCFNANILTVILCSTFARLPLGKTRQRVCGVSLCYLWLHVNQQSSQNLKVNLIKNYDGLVVLQHIFI